MADILIRGVDMPKSCVDCALMIRGRFDGNEWHYVCYGINEDEEVYDDGDVRPSWCPLIELSSHGDLIDRRALLKPFYVRTADEKVIGQFPAIDIRVIKDAPTIVEASDGEI